MDFSKITSKFAGKKRYMKKLLSFILLLMATIVFATWQYRLPCVLLFVLLNRKWLKTLPLLRRWRHSYSCSLLMAIWAVGNFINDCFVVSIGTRDLSGIFSY